MTLSEEKKRKLSFFSVMFTFFVDNLGWSIVFPIFAPLFLDVNNDLFAQSVSFPTRTAVLGVFLAAFPLAQFFGAPILGELADKNGRKKAFTFSIILTFIGYALSAWSIHKSLVLLFISRVICGLFSGNLSVCLASLADLSKDEKSRISNFGYLSMIAGFSFIVGAFLGGKFSDSNINSFFNPALPLWIAAGLSLLNLFFILFAFYETTNLHKDLKYDFLESIHNIQKALKTKKIKQIYLIYFLFVFSWTIVFQFSPVLVIKKFHFSNSDIGNLAAVMGVGWAIGSGLINKILVKKFKPIKILEVALFLFTIICAIVAFFNDVFSVISLLCLSVIIGGLAWPLCANLISSLSPKHMRGKILGMSQSMQSLAMATSPIVGGLVDQFHMSTTFLLAAFASFVAGIVYFIKKGS
jgi:MFS transporter, DHA1 family, tetracycline resistance protein